MSTVRLEAVDIHNSNEKTGMDIPMQPASQDIWDKKSRLKSKAGDAIDADIDATYRLSLIHISSPRDRSVSRMPSSA